MPDASNKPAVTSEKDLPANQKSANRPPATPGVDTNAVPSETPEASAAREHGDRLAKLVTSTVELLNAELEDVTGTDRTRVLDEIVAKVASTKVVAAGPKHRIPRHILESAEAAMPYVPAPTGPGEAPSRNVQTQQDQIAEEKK